MWHTLKVDPLAGQPDGAHLQQPAEEDSGCDGSWLRLTPRGRDCDVADVSVLGSFLAVVQNMSHIKSNSTDETPEIIFQFLRYITCFRF